MTQKLFPSALLSVLLSSTALTSPVLAGCQVNGDETTCTGSLDNVEIVNGTGKLSINILSADIGSVDFQSVGADGVKNEEAGADSSALKAEFDGSHGGASPYGVSFSVSEYRYVAFNVLSTGGDGSVGHNDNSGGNGGNGADARVAFNSGFIKAINNWNNNDSKILYSLLTTSSQGGNGGHGGHSSGDGAHDHIGGSGGGGGHANEAHLSVLSGSFSFDNKSAYMGSTTYGVLVSSKGGSGGYAGAGGSSDINEPAQGGAGGAGGSGGVASAEIDNASLRVNVPSYAFLGAAVRVESIGGNGGFGGEGSADNLGGKATGHFGGPGGDGGTTTLGLGDGADIQSGVGSVWLLSQGGDGGQGGEASAYAGNAQAGDGFRGGYGGYVVLDLGAASVVASGAGHAIVAQSIGGTGGDGGDAESFVDKYSTGGQAGKGGDGGDVSVNRGKATSTIKTLSTDNTQHAIAIESLAGLGGNGGNGTSKVAGNSTGGDGAQGGTGGVVNADIWANIATAGPQSQGVLARSYGGAGGDGGHASALAGKGHGGAAAGSGPGGNVELKFSGSIATAGFEANGILAQSVGGFSGSAGSASGLSAYGAGSESAGAGGQVTVDLDTDVLITTKGDAAHGLSAQSVGGGGGRGGSATGISSLGGSGSAGGDGGAVFATISDGAAIRTSGVLAFGAFAQSVGGGGGDGGGALGISSLGGSGGSGGSGGAVSLSSSGLVETTGGLAAGLYASSVGGGGGAAHATTGFLALGGSGGSGGAGGAISFNNAGAVSTKGDFASALFASSIGGGGGSARTTYGMLAFGGSGGEGGGGGSVNVESSGSITTAGSESNGIFAQSIGGGGGHGSSVGSLNFTSLSTSFGGQGGAGNDGGSVSYKNTGSARSVIATTGHLSRGVFLQSVGGGGGDGGTIVTATFPGSLSGSASFGGLAGAGGDGGNVNYAGGLTDISTEGNHASAIHAQSIGGGGGNGGSALTISTADLVSAQVTFGGRGGAGGDSGKADVLNSGTLATRGDFSHAIVAQSIGGGGGNGGTSYSASAGAVIDLNSAIGGSGAKGGKGDLVTVTGTGAVTTRGQHATGILAQSIGGGGGNGGNSLSGSGISLGTFGSSVGGSGGGGGDANVTTVQWADAITTHGNHSAGVTAQSIGGGGGSGGTSVSGSIASGVTAQVAVGGSGGEGGKSNNVSVDLKGKVSTSGNIAPGLRAHSVGGGGGHSGLTIAGSGVSDFSFNASVGGRGGSGGDAYSVYVNVADVSTQGHGSAAISALSVGGGGGASRFTGAFSEQSNISMNTSVGGSGGVGGDGGGVNVAVTGSLDTAGHDSAGIKALSVGGGGGDSGVTATGAFSSEGSFGITVGGDGGASGSGGNVQVTTATNTTITTFGDNSEGIFAQSTARSGGSAGHTITADAFTSATMGITLGGHGGTGGDGGTVNVTNLAGISTQGIFASGLEARSLGGGGGSAKGSINVSAMSVGAADLTVGGNGGAGGKGGAVTVESHGAIGTSGLLAFGIQAQSLGGSGGNGGFAAHGSGTGGEVSGEISVALGGSGGAGGLGGAVQVTASNTISTGDFGASAILAQSIGGNGGAGGNVYNGTVSTSSDGSLTANLNLGGTGGTGAVAGTVTVNNSADIVTGSYFSDAIIAQSIGGSGGKGGSVYSVLLTAQGSNSLNVDVDIGGKGGNGAHADQVVVNSSGSIKTTKGASDGVVAMSIGGGGGKGGSTANLNIAPLSSSLSASEGGGTNISASVNVGVGGSGGSGGDGKTATVVNTASINTAGIGSRGIYAQSVGGGGGDGGSTSSASFSFDGLCTTFTGGTGYECKPEEEDPDNKTTDIEVSLAVEIGGSGGAAGNADTVSVNNSGDIVTSGDLSHGIVAHSQGGGGGNGGNGALGINGWTDNATANWIANLPGNFSFLPDFNSIDIGVGGSGGASGQGGAVSVINSGTIATKGNQAFGIHAQSVGGGGGNGGAGSTGLWSKATVGGRGSGGGNGGSVTVDQTGAITTSGRGGVGIFAQSVGGGGGTAGDVETGWTSPWANLNIGAGVGVQLSAGAGGNGGDITVTASSITTTGDSAHGIVAQSVGGSGGIAGISGKVGDTLLRSFVGGSGDQGNSGAVLINVNGPVLVSGPNAHGIFAQSATGRLAQGDAASDVTVNVNADVAASGTGGRAILAQSQGDNNGKIAINVAKGAAVSTAAGGYETIGLMDGTGNVLNNLGTIRNAGAGAQDYVIRTNGSALAVNNQGTISGSILSRLGDTFSSSDGAIDFINNAGASFNLGATVDLGNGGTLNNSGAISAGGSGVIATSSIAGNLTQTSTGTTGVDFVFGGGNDLIAVTRGVSVLAGTVDPTPQKTLPRSGDAGNFAIITSAQGIAGNTLTVANTATVDYSLSEKASAGGGTQVDLGYNVNFTPWTDDSAGKVPGHVWSLLRNNHTHFGNHVDQLVGWSRSSPGGSNSFSDELVSNLLKVKTVDELVLIYDSFAPGSIFTPGYAALHGSLRFSDQLMSCPAPGEQGSAISGQEGSCVWARVTGVATRQKGWASSSVGYDEDAFGLSAGVQAEFRPGWFAGFALGYESSQIESNRAKGDSDRYHVGAVLKHEIGATLLALSVAGGTGETDFERPAYTPQGWGVARSDPLTNWISGHARISHNFDVSKTVYLKPSLDVGVERVWQDSYTESGVGLHGLSIGSIDSTFVSLNPMLEIGTAFNIGNVAAEATLSGGVLSLFGDTKQSVGARLHGIGSFGPRYLITDEAEDLFAKVATGVKARLNENITIEAGAGTLLGSKQSEYYGTAKLKVSF